MANTYGLPGDFITTTLTADVTASATNLFVADPSRMAANTYLTIDPSDTTNREVVYVTAVNTSAKSVTVTRAQGGTTAVAHSSGDKIVGSVVAETIEDLKANLEANVDTSVATLPSLATAGTAGNPASDGNPGTATSASRSDHIHHFKVGSFTRTAAAGAGNQAVTGVGFTPTLILFEANYGEAISPFLNFVSLGAATAATGECMYLHNYDQGSSEYRLKADFGPGYIIVGINVSDTVVAQATLVSMDADGFTINWSTMTQDTTVHYTALG